MKKITSLLLVLGLIVGILSPMAAIAYEGDGEYYVEDGDEYYVEKEYYDDKEYYDEEDYYPPYYERLMNATPVMQTAYYNGEQFELSVLGGQFVQYTPIAKAIGYTTSFNAETSTVTSVKDGRKVSFVINPYHTQATITDGGLVSEVYSENLVRNGSTYVQYWDIVQFFGVQMAGNYYGSSRLEWYDKATLVDYFKSKVNGLDKYTESFKLPQEYSLVYDMSSDLDATSKLFGINVTGKNDTHIKVDRKGDVVTVDGTSANQGLFNFWNLMWAMDGNKNLPYYKDKFDFTKPVEFKAYYSKDELYAKSDVFVPVFVMNALPWDIRSEKLNEVAERIDNKWVKAWISDQDIERISSLISSFESGNRDAIWEMIVEQTISNYGYYNTPAIEGSIYNHALQRLDNIANIFTNAITVENSNGQITLTFKMNSETLKQLIIQMSGNSDSAEYINNINYAFDMIEFNVEQKMVKYSDNTMKMSGSLVGKLKNIPNSFNLDCGSVTINTSFVGELSTKANLLEKPVDFVDYKQIAGDLQDE